MYFTLKLTRHFWYVQQDSQSSKLSEKDSKPTKGKKILEEALKAHAHKKNPAKK